MYKFVTVGGTFAYLHKGHKRILSKAFDVSEKVVVGVTSQKFLRRIRRNNKKNKGYTFIIGFVERRKEVEEFLREKGFDKRAEIVKIEDMFGPLKEQRARLPASQAKSKEQSNFGKIQAMVVTKETRRNAETINRWRREHGLDELDLVEVEMVLAEDGRPISSRRIRGGEINREGIVYGMHKLWGRLPRALREELRKPLGKVYPEGSSARLQRKSVKFSLPAGRHGVPSEKVISRSCLDGSRTGIIIAIGDVSTKKLIEAGIKPEVAVFDLKVMREKIFTAPEDIGIDKDYQLLRIKNHSGQVTEGLYTFFSHLNNHVIRKVRIIQAGKLQQISQLDNHVDAEVRKIGRGNGWEIVRGAITEMRGGFEIRGRKAGNKRVNIEVKLQKKVALWVEGEEDLAALPAILFAPLESLVVYGQPPVLNSKFKIQNSKLRKNTERKEACQGLVVVEVTEEKKKKIFEILQRFERKAV